MSVPQEKRYLCVVCMESEIVEKRVEHRRALTEAPERSGCEYKEYTDYCTMGGRLLIQRQSIPWNYSSVPATQVGGICDTCLANIAIVKALTPHINLS